MKQKNIYDFHQYETITSVGDKIIRSVGESIYNQNASIVEVADDQGNLLNIIVEFNNKSRLRSKEGKGKKGDTYESAYALYESRKLALNAFKSKIFLINTRKRIGNINS